MKKEIVFALDDDVYEKFCIALRLVNENENEVLENCIRNYISKTFERVSQEYSHDTGAYMNVTSERDFYGKAIQKIPVWALKPNQYNHKIIRAFFEAEENAEKVTLDAMELLCSNKERSELYVPTFKNNYSQMKIDGPKSYGKVFEDDGERVWIWKEAEEVLRKYKDNFLNRR